MCSDEFSLKQALGARVMERVRVTVGVTATVEMWIEGRVVRVTLGGGARVTERVRVTVGV